MPAFKTLVDLELYELKNELNELGRPWATWEDNKGRRFVVIDYEWDEDHNTTAVRLYNVGTAEMNWLAITDLLHYRYIGKMRRIAFFDRVAQMPILNR